MIGYNKTKRKIIRVLLGLVSFLIVVFLVTTIYYIKEVRNARRDTQALFTSALKHYGTQLSLSGLSPERKTMLIAIQDHRFYHHHGVDLEPPGARMTTLTQGLVKLLYFPDGFRPGVRKLRQTLIAKYALDALVSKDNQLLLFLNICYLGHENDQSINGFANAARVYFGKEFSSITDDEFLSLIAMLSRPNALKPGTTANTKRVQRIKTSLSGEQRSEGNYNGQQQRRFSEKACMAILRLIVNALPD